MNPHGPSSFAELGWAVVPSLFTAPECDSLGSLLERDRPGVRLDRSLLDLDWCQQLAARVRTHPALAAFLLPEMEAIQATLFAKDTTSNWLVAFHQDLSVPVAGPGSWPGSTGWSQKQGRWFVQPPPAWMDRLTAVRLQIDEPEANNGSLVVLSRSHREGRIGDQRRLDLVRQGAPDAPLVPRGGALLMRPHLLHASPKTRSSGPRRVIHFLFAPPRPTI